MVKIVTSIPLRRGRWNVVDYPDKEKTTSKEPTAPTASAASIPQAAVQPANPNPQGQSVVTAEIPKSETDSNASNSSVQPPLQPQQPPNFSGATTLVPSSGQMQQQAAENNPAAGQRAPNAQQQPAGGNLNTVRTVPNNLHNLGAMPAQTSPADPNVVVTTHHTFAGNQVRV